MTFHRLLTLAFAFAAASGAAQTDDWTAFREGVAESVARGAGDALAGQINSLETVSGAPDGWTAYWSAYLHYRRALLSEPSGGMVPAMEACLREADSAVESAAEEDALHAESLALLGACHSGLASSGPVAGMKHGPRAGMLRDESLFIAPDNPRVLLLAGAQDVWTPVQWGGSPERAERRLTKALEQFDAVGEALPWQPRWGRSDAIGHLALALDKLDRSDQALALLEQARNDGHWNGWLERIERGISSSGSGPS
jgi:tetratricopeptide (TPR) repeat protein